LAKDSANRYGQALFLGALLRWAEIGSQRAKLEEFKRETVEKS
jgi:hypothetical protein